MPNVRFSNFEGLIQAIADKLGPLSGEHAPYLDNWEGCIYAIWDCVAAGVVRGEGYPDSIVGFQQILWDFFGGVPGYDISDLYDPTYEDTIRLLKDYLNASRPEGFPNNMEGLILAFQNATFVNLPDRLLLEDGSYILLESGFKIKPQYA